MESLGSRNLTAKTTSYGRCRWKIIYIRKDLFLPLGGIAKNSTTMKDEEWEVLDIKALGTIWLSLTTSVAFNISKEKTMKDMMDALDKLYEKPSVSNKVFLMKILFNMKMS
jgi:hypothetical protein